jgi:rhodanese-related sulfurtransferase
MKRGAQPLTPREFETIVNTTGAVMLDVRSKNEFVKEYVPNSIFIGLDGSFAPWVGALVPDVEQEIVVVAPEGKEKETVMRLARVGFDNTLGYLKGGITAWKAAGMDVESITSIDVSEFAERFGKEENVKILDVRKPGEWKAGHIQDAQNFPLDFINRNMSEVDKQQSYFVHCRSGYRSTIAASILKARGYHNLVDVIGSFDEIKKSQIPVTDSSDSPSTVS